MGAHTATKANPATKAQPVDHGTAGHTEKPKKPSAGKKVGTRAVEGATAGSAAGPVGTAVGAVAGTVEGAVEAKKERNEYNRTYSASNKALVAEFVICIAILILTPLVNGGADITVAKFMKKASATAGVFIVLGFVSSIGDTSRKVAQGLGLLVTLTVLLNERSAFGQLVKAVSGEGKPTVALKPSTALTDSVNSGVTSAGNAITSTFDAARARAVQVSR